ncbi:hypothetical protein ACIPM2_32890 [Streptomyces sp. NPDC086081]|uniref:hypothetical protein n=1 Tax=Streptomyces sp. NPDC086081 TaxID=3365749 RepID=UPI003808B540
MAASAEPLTRRSLIRTGAGLAVVGLGATTAASASAATSSPSTAAASMAQAGRGLDARLRTGENSANGWPMEKGADIGGSIWTQAVAGSSIRVALHLGDVSTVLIHVLRRYHYEVDTLVQDEVVGYRSPDRFLKGPATNHASGTALAIRPGAYPPAATGGLFPHQRSVIADIVKECGGVVRWGGTFDRPYEAHFQIDVAPTDPRLTKVADRVRQWDQTPGQGAGVLALGR